MGRLVYRAARVAWLADAGEVMNEIFREHVTSTAFCLQLTKRQCWELLMAVSGKKCYRHSMTSLRCLEARGLVAWHRDSKGQSNGMYVTRAGELAAELLKEAGMTEENMTPARYLVAA